MAEIPTSDWTWIDAAAVRFEQEWKAGASPRIETFLAEVDESRCPLLLEELLRVERELLDRAGDEPDVDEYRRRFPGSAALIDAVFRRSRGNPPRPALIRHTSPRLPPDRLLLAGIATASRIRHPARSCATSAITS